MDVFYALAEPNRRTIIELLAKDGELSASAIARKFKITAAAVSQHLKVLKEAGVVHMEKRAQQRIYTLNPDAMRQLEQWANQVSESDDRLEELLNNK
jgi:DNA-binding transcriptional ArsR family regulator